MAPRITPPIEALPVEIIANILRHFDNIHELQVAVPSHRIFYNAFKENELSITWSIITDEISGYTLPFALALLEASRSDPEDPKAVPKVMKDLKDHTSDRRVAIERLAALTTSDLGVMSRTHSVIVSLCEKFCKATLPLYDKWLGNGTPLEAVPRDRFRIRRALYRYQIMCHLMCQPADHRSGNDETIEYERQQVLLAFSPWVNEQLICIYFFLQRILWEAYDDVAAHDIVWGGIPVFWSDDAWWGESEEDQVQDLLVHGLEFLNSVAEATTFDKRADLLHNAVDELNAAAKPSVAWGGQNISPWEHMDSMSAFDDPLEEQGLEFGASLAEAHRAGFLEPLASSLDIPDTTMSSKSAKTWFHSNHIHPLCITVGSYDDNANLWMCGYVIWNASHRKRDREFRMKVSEIREKPLIFQRLRASYNDETVERSEARRADLCRAGAKGYWPLEGIDFGRVHDLNEEEKTRLLEKWKMEETRAKEHPVDESGADKDESTSSDQDDIQTEAKGEK